MSYRPSPAPQPRYTAEILVEFLDVTDTTRDFDLDRLQALTKDEADAVLADRVTTWTDLGYSVRHGDGWATGVSATVKARVLVERELGDEPSWRDYPRG